MSARQHIDPAARTVVAVAAMTSSMMVVIDSTIAAVALPHMQASTGASPEQVMWVLTSYMISTAIFTPLSGWLANRFGRKLIMLGSLGGFTLASMLCGSATDLPTLVMARVLQGACGAGMQPLSQAALLDIYPKEKHARVLAIQGMASMVGPLFGPTLGGWLTDVMTWRWVFLINVPFGVLAFSTILALLPEERDPETIRFDLFGFSMLAMGLAALQLFLDRGEQMDWLESPEIILWAVLAGLGGWMTVVHTMLGRAPFLNPALFRDWNFIICCAFVAVLAIAAFGTQPMTTFMLQQLMGYTALRAGTMTAVASLSSLVAVVLFSGVLGRIGPRFMICCGLVLLGISQIMYASLNLYIDAWPVLAAGLVKGAGMGLVYAVLPGLTYATLAPGLRNEGAAFNALVRNMGMSVGISLMTIHAVHDTAAVRSRLVEGIRPDNPLLPWAMPSLDFGSADSLAQVAGEIGRQATMVGYVEAFYLSGVLAFAMIPATLLMRVRR